MIVDYNKNESADRTSCREYSLALFSIWPHRLFGLLWQSTLGRIFHPGRRQDTDTPPAPRGGNLPRWAQEGTDNQAVGDRFVTFDPSPLVQVDNGGHEPLVTAGTN